MKRLLIVAFLFISLTVNHYIIRYERFKVEEKEIVKVKTDDKHKLNKDLLHSIMYVESKFNHSIVNKKENAVGILQIRPIMVRDINLNILKRQTYHLDDRLDSAKSVNMFIIYQNHYNPKLDFEKAIRIWNGGPNGMNKNATKGYYNKVIAYGKKRNGSESFKKLNYY